MRLSTSFLLILVFLTIRLVPFVHAHEFGERPVGHDSRPHVHLHGHEHEHGHSHHDHVHSQEHELAVRATVSLSFGVTPANHDDDAIYVEMLSSVAATAVGRAEVLSVTGCVCSAAAWPASVALSPPEAVAEPPPRIRIDGPPLFLRNLSLRI